MADDMTIDDRIRGLLAYIEQHGMEKDTERDVHIGFVSGEMSWMYGYLRGLWDNRVISEDEYHDYMHDLKQYVVEIISR